MSAWNKKSENVFLSKSVQQAKKRVGSKTLFSGVYLPDDILKLVIQFLEPHEYFSMLTVNIDFYDLIRNYYKPEYLTFMQNYNHLSKYYSYLLFLKTTGFDKEIINEFEICLKEKEIKKIYCFVANKFVNVMSDKNKIVDMRTFCALLKIINDDHINYVKFCKIYKINKRDVHIMYPLEKPLQYKEYLQNYAKYVRANLLKLKHKKTENFIL